ncbi:MAG: lysophospholipid acyltransferase family protein [Candidatus Poribacteria bacterium]|nr:lysophospholipid acyltransferase family protein [Candidatus Poribacteria bacterium]
MPRNKWTDSTVYLTVLVFSWVCCILTRKWAMGLGSAIGKLLYRILKKRRQIALNNMQIAFGDDLKQTHRQEICKACFINFGKTVIEFMRFPKLNAENIWCEVTVHGREHLNSALEKGKGAIVFLPHFGNWELLSLVYGALIPNRAKAIAFPLKNARLNDLIWRHRQLLSLELIPRKNAIRATLRALKNNDAVGFFADQNAGDQGVFIDFFGKPASTARGPVSIALKTRAPILFSLDIRQPDDRHHVHISPPLHLELSDDFEKDVESYTAHLMKQLEKYIQKYPDQWFWIHNRWKTQPNPNRQEIRKKS